MIVRNIAVTGLLILFAACGQEQRGFNSNTNSKVADNQEKSSENPVLDNSENQIVVNSNTSTPPESVQQPSNGQQNTIFKPGFYSANMSSGGFLTVELKNNNFAKSNIIFGISSPTPQTCEANLQASGSDTNSVTFNMNLSPKNSNICARNNCRIRISTYQGDRFKAEIVCADMPMKDEGILVDCSTVLCT